MNYGIDLEQNNTSDSYICESVIFELTNEITDSSWKELERDSLIHSEVRTFIW